MSDHLEAGLTPDEAARRIMDAVRKGKEEVIVGFDSLWLAVTLKRFTPGLFSKILRKAKIN
jgi:short-subunit dehydrogenase